MKDGPISTKPSFKIEIFIEKEDLENIKLLSSYSVLL